VTDRRQSFAGLAAFPLSAAGRGPETTAFGASPSGPCPDPIPGSVTNPCGSIGRTPLRTSLTPTPDRRGRLAARAGLGPDQQARSLRRYRQNQVVVDENWLLVVQLAYRSDWQPAPFATGTCQVGGAVTDPGGNAT
jgi:hypothetical protein